MTRSPERAYTWVCPSVAALADIYGRNCPLMWMDAQVTHLFLTSASRDAAGAEAQTRAFVEAFTGTSGAYRLSEMMLFFARYKAGVYGRSFALFDLRGVGQAFHQEFLPDRKRELATIEDKLLSRRMASMAERRSEHCTSHEAFLAMPASQPVRLTIRLHPKMTLQAARQLIAAVGQEWAEAVERARTGGNELFITLPKGRLTVLDVFQRAHVLEVADSKFCNS